MEQKLLEFILAESFTPGQALEKLRLLQDFLITKLFTSAGQENQQTEPEKTSNEQLEWLRSIEPDFLQQFNTRNLYQIFDSIEETLKKTDALIFFLPFEPPESEIIQLGKIVRQNYGQNLLIEIKFNPALIAGPSLSWKGVYKDYSLHQKIEENRQLILQTFKEFLR